MFNPLCSSDDLLGEGIDLRHVGFRLCPDNQRIVMLPGSTGIDFQKRWSDLAERRNRNFASRIGWILIYKVRKRLQIEIGNGQASHRGCRHFPSPMIDKHRSAMEPTDSEPMSSVKRRCTSPV